MAKEPSTITLTISLWDCLDVEVGPAENGLPPEKWPSLK